MEAQEHTIKFIRLVTGEDIISDVVHVTNDDNNYYVLSNPLKVMYLAGGKPGILSISLMQWVFWRICDHQEFTLYPEDVLTIANTSDHMENYYYKSVEHFNEVKEDLNNRTEFRSDYINDTDVSGNEDEDDHEVIQSVMDMLKNMGDKRKLH
jgi:hypothetical protein